ncbi:MAG TPA: S41 family peptidase [Allosphingosinicella sp.]|jgi:C-terminal processing protease CtpA/Prc
MLALLSACGGGGGGGGDGTIVVPPPTTPPPAQTAGCSLRERQDWAAAQLREWYLFPDLLATSANPANYSSVQDYIDALVAPARAQNRDRFFTYVTSIQEENAFYESGSSAGFGFRLALDASNRLLISESFEDTPALAAGIDRGTEIVAIGTSTGNLRTVSSIIASEGSAGLNNALGPATIGTSRTFQVRDLNGATRTVTIAKAEYEIDPVSARYGARIINDGGKNVGYINLRTFIGPANTALRSAFAQFKAAGITEVIVDFRYNGGGLVSVAELLSNLLGGGRSTSDVLSYTTFRAEKAVNNQTDFFAPLPESINATKIAFIGTGSSASASELVMNAFIPYLRGNTALIGSNTYGKPVGQIAIDRPACDDRLRVIAFATQNADRQGDYFTGLASKFQTTCRATDDITRPLGDPQEASIRAALDFLGGRQCTPITSTATTQGLREGMGRGDLLLPEQPTGTIQRELPGSY